MIQRYLYKQIDKNISKQKVSLLFGARRIGKTEVLREIFDAYKDDAIWLNGEDADTITLLEKGTVSNYKRLLNGKKLLIIDEAQYIPEIGKKVKLMIDEIKPLHIIITGSSAFELGQETGQPLVGRSISYQMFPIAQLELKAQENLLVTKSELPVRLVYGSYPEQLMHENLIDKQEYLNELVNTFLFKDILAFEQLKNPQKLRDILMMVAYQVGSELSIEEVGRKVQLSKNTVERYLDLLQKAFIIYRRTGFNKNLRKEIVKSHKWYFYDNGVMNALIGDFRQIELRNNLGKLWENYIQAERMKFLGSKRSKVNSFFWRTYDQQEIDLVETENEKIEAYEMKWSMHKPAKIPAAFAKAYPDASFEEINPENYLDFIGA